MLLTPLLCPPPCGHSLIAALQFSPEEVEACLAKIQAVSYNEVGLGPRARPGACPLHTPCSAPCPPFPRFSTQTIPLYERLQAHPVSSGYSIGATNWVFEDGLARFAYVSSSSTAMQRHPLPMNRVGQGRRLAGLCSRLRKPLNANIPFAQSDGIEQLRCDACDGHGHGTRAAGRCHQRAVCAARYVEDILCRP